MDSQSWLAMNWQPLLIGGVIGLILGWLFTWLSYRGRVSDLEAQVSSLNSKLRNAEKDLSEAQRQAKVLEGNVNDAEITASEARAELVATQRDMQSLTVEHEEVQAEAANLRSQYSELQDNSVLLISQQDAMEGERSTIDDQIAETLAETETLKANLEETSVELALCREENVVSKETLDNKEIALNEAYLRAANLQREVMEQQRLLASTESELRELRSNVSVLTSLNADLESNLENARGEVAGELALLTSTMLRMKEDELADANVRIAALTSELEMLTGNPSTSE
ncbi:MAG: hypothetical protein U9R25_15535 [Chloroflexota bacterium]|nr:hypothetical protein [Chloroflexota bacterium]